MSSTEMNFKEQYGPWAMVVGASEGVGEAFAHAMAEHGLNVVLLARRQEVLDEVAEAISNKTGVETRAVAVDLSEADAVARVAEATAGLDIGMLFYCAGADPNHDPFLTTPVDASLALVQRNCTVPLQMCHHFAPAMVERQRGGIILVSSGAGLCGAANMVAYAASKAFDMVMAESLWAELKDEGVDVLSLVLSGTDTPALRRSLVLQGKLDEADAQIHIPGLSTPEEVVAEAIENLSNGPTWLVGDRLREAATKLRSMTRSEAVKTMLEMQRGGLMSTDHRAKSKP